MFIIFGRLQLHSGCSGKRSVSFVNMDTASHSLSGFRMKVMDCDKISTELKFQHDIQRSKSDEISFLIMSFIFPTLANYLILMSKSLKKGIHECCHEDKRCNTVNHKEMRDDFVSGNIVSGFGFCTYILIILHLLLRTLISHLLKDY